MRPRALAWLALAAAVSSPCLAQEASEPLALKKIVLYKHGVGFFERGGQVTGDATVPLAFKAGQMQDVLKSLFAVDLGGGQVSTVLYDTKDPLQKQLEDFLFRVPGEKSLTSLLTQLQGVRVQVSVGSRAVTGRVLGIEPTQRRADGEVLSTPRLVLLRDDGAIETLELLDAQQVVILDAAVRDDLARMMEVQARAQHADRKTVQVQAKGTGTRELRIGYILETPIWKTWYRLLLEDGEQPLMQGWAIVENTTDEDWDEVQLSFVAGSPQSFVLDLYTSYYPTRPVLQMAGAAADKAAAPRRSRGRGGPGTPGPAGPSTPGPGAGGPARGLAAGSDEFFAGGSVRTTFAPQAETEALGGDLFSYTAKAPVSIRRNQAALVPILQEALKESPRVLWYRAADGRLARHAVYLHNTTELTLEKGPVTVFERSTCLGEAMLGRTLKPGMKEMLAFGFAPAVEVESAAQGDSLPITQGVLSNGLLTLRRTQVRETRYTIRNKGGEAGTLYLDHPVAGGDYTLAAPAEAHDTLAGYKRFAVALPADPDAQTLLVREQRPTETTVQLGNIDADRVAFFARQEYLSAADRARLADAAALMRQKVIQERGAAALEEERGRLRTRQEEVRKNIAVLGQSPQERALRETYVQRLAQAIDRMDAIDEELRAARAEIDRLAGEIAAKVGASRD